MHLKRLELSGFKSFARPSKFNFDMPITAIVGPNGSGKSNVAEAIQWVLGEQSIKSLRGKKGEDLIFNGSPSTPRMSKASATLVFDNTKNQFPIDFKEIAISRMVYRDGINDYFINNSKVRMKDIIELLANVGLGSSQHHIISQGETDRILYASNKDRRQMIEDALGLKIYQIRRREAERKLERTNENIKQAEALQKEIQPHLKFLKKQVEKHQKAAELRSKIKELYLEYLSTESIFLDKTSGELKQKKEPILNKLHKLEHGLGNIKKHIKSEDKPKETTAIIEKLEKELAQLRQQKSQLERDLGRLEGIIELEQSKTDREEDEVITKMDVEELLHSIEGVLSSALEEDMLERIYSIIQEVLYQVSSFFGRLEDSGETENKINLKELIKKRGEAKDALEELIKKEKSLEKKQKEISSAVHASEKQELEAQREVYKLESQINELKDDLRSLEIEEAKLKMKLDEYERHRQEGMYYLDGKEIKKSEKILSTEEKEKIKKDIDRLKFKIEDAGGIDSSVIKEYDDIQKREDFFEKELADLKETSLKLKALTKDLNKKIDEEFNSGITKINKEFQKYFELMFGGGKAELKVIKIQKSAKQEAMEDLSAEASAEEEEGGITMSVNLPRKKIRSLDMLSGGERALTSIALLFALTSVNPPPFLVLDETDAMLDETNSRKYAQMLQSLSKNTQLITITHNRQTMEEAGILYGVTMGREGVSKLLSLKLEEAEKIAPR